MRPFNISLSLLLGLVVAIPSISLAAPRQQGVGIKDGECEVVSVGQYLCKIDGKCYYCDTKTNPDKNKNCYKETTCAAATTRPGIKGNVRPPAGMNAPLLRRGIEGETSGEAGSGTTDEAKSK